MGDYKGIEVEKKEAEVSEEEITAEIDKAREANSRLITIEDRATETEILLSSTLMVM